MRLDYVPNPPTGLSSDDQAVLDRVKARRGAGGLIPLDLTLLHSPAVTDGESSPTLACSAKKSLELTRSLTGWSSLLGAIRTKTSLSPSIREIAICRPALINKAWFEWNAHAPILLDAPGFSEAKLKTVQQLHPTAQGELDDKEWAVLLYADEMTRNVTVDGKTFERLKTVGFDEKAIVEITATVASYNLVSRFLVALDVGEQNDKAPEWASGVTKP